MTVRLNPYISLRDTAVEAMDLYRSVFGGELTRMTFGDAHLGDAAEADKVMHSHLHVEGVLDLMVADTPAGMEVSSGNHAISLSGDDEVTLRGWWDGLSDGATVTMPLATAPWGDTFGQLVDRFGVAWLVNITGPQA